MVHREGYPNHGPAVSPDQLAAMIRQPLQLVLDLYDHMDDQKLDDSPMLHDLIKSTIDLVANHIEPGERRLVAAMQPDVEMVFLDLMNLALPEEVDPDKATTVLELPMLRVTGAYLEREVMEDFGAQYYVGRHQA